MKAESIMNPSLEALLFIEKLGQGTGVSGHFLDAAMPVVEKAYSQIHGKRRLECFEAIWEAARRQAETEKAVASALEMVRKLEEKRRSLRSRLENMQKSTIAAQNTVSMHLAGVKGGPARASSPWFES